MLYTTRFRLKESLTPKDMVEVNRLIDTKIIPAANNVEGVRSSACYQSSNGELIMILDVATWPHRRSHPGRQGLSGCLWQFYAHSVHRRRFSSTGRRGGALYGRTS